MAEDSAAKWTRRGILTAAGATVAVTTAEKLGLLRPDLKVDQILPGYVKILRTDPLRTSPSIPEGDKVVSNPNIASWDEIEEMDGKPQLTTSDLPLVMGQNPDGPGQAEWAKIELTEKGPLGGKKRYYIPAQDILRRNPSIKPLKVVKIQNDFFGTSAGTFHKDQLGKVHNLQSS